MLTLVSYPDFIAVGGLGHAMTAKIIMVTSGKGGVGKSSVCAGIAYYLAQMNHKVLVIEMDSGLRCLDIMLGVSQDTVYDIADVLMSRCGPIKAIYPSPLCKTLFMMPATLNPESGYSPELFERLCRGLSNYYDYIFIETPAGFGQTLCDIASVSDAALIVVTPDPISLRDARILSDYLDDRGMDRQRVVVNKVKMIHGKPEVLPDLDVVIDTVCEPLIGVIPYETRLNRLLAQGQAIGTNCVAGQAMRNIARRISGEFVDLAVH